MADEEEPMHEHIAALGWKSLGDTSGHQVDGVGTSEHYIGRAWSPTGNYEAIPAAGGMYVFLTVEGLGNVTYDGTPLLDVGRDHLVFMDSEADINVDLTAPTARYLWKLRPTVLNNPLVREHMGEPLHVGPDVWKIAGALTNSALEAPPAIANSQYLSQASESLLAAVFSSAKQPSRLTPSTRPDLVYGEAMHVIEQSFRDPNLSPTLIAQTILVSYRTLRRAFAAMGTSPRGEIERRRVRELRELRAHFGVALSFGDLSEMAGFKTARQGRAALQRN
jgi:AraC-like DNA-binding protein